MHQKQSTGFSLLELLLVFAIAAALIFAGIGQYKRLSRQKDIEAVKYNVALVRNASIDYYRKHLNNKTAPFLEGDFTKKLCDDGLWPKLLATKLITDNSCVKNKTSYAVTAEKIATPVEGADVTYKFTVAITLTESANLEWLKNTLNATSSTAPATLIWLYLPTYSTPTMDTGLWLLNTDLQQFKRENTIIK